MNFPLDKPLDGTAYLTVSSSMQSGKPPVVTLNGTSAGIVGSLPNHNDSTIGRQADRSGYPRLAVLSFPASLLTAGDNTITFTTGDGGASGNPQPNPPSGGFGRDTIVLEVDGSQPARPARLSGKVTGLGTSRGTSNWRVEVANHGSGPADDVRLDVLDWADGRRKAGEHPAVVGADPNSFPVPVAATIAPAMIAPGATASVTVRTHGSRPPGGSGALEFGVSANAGRTRTTAGGQPGH